MPFSHDSTRFPDPLFTVHGEMGARLHDHDWTDTPLGPPGTWPTALRTALHLMLTSRQPMYLAWSRELIALYNDAYRPILGEDKHPWAFGSRTADIFANDGYPGLKPVFDAVLDRGESAAFTDLLVPLQRHGYLEECYFDVSYNPVYVDTHVGGVFCLVNETTERVLSARRTRTLATLTGALLGAQDTQTITRAILETAEHNPFDLPVVLVYLPDTHGTLQLAGAAGLAAPQVADLHLTPEVWTAQDAAQFLPIPPLATGPWPERVQHLVPLPLKRGDGDAFLGLLAVGLNPRKQLDDPYLDFLHLFRGQVIAALHTAQLARNVRQRNAELDARTKALESFASLTRDLALETNPYLLIQRAQDVVLGHLPHAASAYYEPEGDTWHLRSRAGGVPDPTVDALVNGPFPMAQVQNLSRPWRTRRPYYQDAYDRDTDGFPAETQSIATTAALPVMVEDTPRGMLSVMLFEPRTWTPADKALLESVVHSLGLALERAQNLAQLDAQRRSLAAANEELEAFAYSVSHDLRTPVRHILGFSQLLRKSLPSPVDANAGRYLNVIQEAAERMNLLIDAMLNLSRTTRQPLRLSQVDLTGVVEDVRRELAAETAGRKVTWRVSDLPVVSGDQHLLRQVMANLLSNAVKYTRRQDEAVIEVWAEHENGKATVFVRDNGVGFDGDYASKLFGVFQRLHRAEEFEGVGVGLANVRRIVGRHGGHVMAQGEVGRGATFAFTLPMAE